MNGAAPMMAMPQVPTTAAPMMSYAAAPMMPVQHSSNFVPMRQASGAHNGHPMMPMPQELAGPPENQLSAIPHPDSISQQKSSISNGIDEQLSSGESLLAARHRQQTDYIDCIVLQQKKQYALDVDKAARQQEMVLTQQFQVQVTVLAEQMHRQKVELEKQASHLTEDYNMKAAHESLAHETYHLQVKAMAEENQMQGELAKLQTRYSEQQQAMQHAQMSPPMPTPYSSVPQRYSSAPVAMPTTYSMR